MGRTIIAKIEVSQSRRWFGIGLHILLGVGLISIGFLGPSELLMQLLLVLSGAAVLWSGKRMYDATHGWLALTDDDLVDHQGYSLVSIDDIVRVDRGVFAFKPANGFLIVCREAGESCWNPGMWWRLGRHLGVGGVTQAGQAKIVADLISLKLTQRN